MAIFSENDIKNKLFHINNFFNLKQINEKDARIYLGIIEDYIYKLFLKYGDIFEIPNDIRQMNSYSKIFLMINLIDKINSEIVHKIIPFEKNNFMEYIYLKRVNDDIMWQLVEVINFDKPISCDNFLNNILPTGIQFKMKKIATRNIDAAKIAAQIELGRAIITAVKTSIRPMMPMIFRGYMDATFFDLIIANILVVAQEQFRPDDQRFKIIADSVNIAAYNNITSELNFSAKIEEFLDKIPNLNQLIETITAEVVTDTK